MLDNEKTTLLDQPLDMTQIKHRQGGGGRQLAYISGKFAMDQANRIFGYGQWGYKVVNRGQLLIDGPDGSKLTMYTADVELWVKGAEFAFPGAGVGIVTKPYTVDMHEKAYKEAETDAMKRALRHYGDQFGLCLYDGDDYVDAGNGEMVQVKNVPIQGRSQQQASRQAPVAPPRANPQAAASSNKSEADDDRKPCTPEQIAGLRQLYQKLNREVPADISQKSFLTVKRLMEQAVGEYRELRNNQHGHSAPTSSVNAPDVKSLRARCVKLGLKWETVVTTTLKSNLPDDNITPDGQARIKQWLDNYEEVRTRRGAEQKAAS